MLTNAKTHRRGDRVHQFTTIEGRNTKDMFTPAYAMGGTVLAASMTRAYVQWDFGYTGPVWQKNAYVYPGEPPEGYLTGYEECSP